LGVRFTGPADLRAKARKELQRRARAAIAKVRDENFEEFCRGVERDIKNDLHAKQLDVVQLIEAGTRFISLCCSRRAGKTYLLACLIVLKLLTAGFHQAVFFVAPTMDIGKDLIWDDVQRIHDLYGLGWKLSEREGEIHTPSGASFHIIGLNDKKQTGKTRGYDMVMCLCDETQEIEHLLRPFIVATMPALAARKGVFVASGTPGIARRGYWYGLCHGQTPQERQGFVHRHWDLRDNPKLPRNAEEIHAEELARNGWTREHPTFQREWLGLWVDDHNFLVVEYASKRDDLSALPDEYSLAWKHVIGIDYGYNDAVAWLVITMHPYTGYRYFVHAEKLTHATYDDAAERTKTLVQQYATTNVVCDPAGGGKPFYETFNRKYGTETGCTIRSAHKVAGSIVESVRFLNTELRCTRLKLVQPACTALSDEISVIRWKDEWHNEILESTEYPQDAFDAGRYALMETIAWKTKERPPLPEADPETQREMRSIAERRRRQDNANPLAALRNRFG
jgi:hypothetical protein